MPPAPQIGQTLQVVAVPGGQAAAFAFPGIAPGSAIGSSIVWKPGAVPADNVYATWATALAAAVAASAAGNVALFIDNSLGPAVIDNVGMPVGGWDMQGRIYRFGGSKSPDTICEIADGAQLLNDPGAQDLRTNLNAGISGVASLRYSHAMDVYYERAVLSLALATTPGIEIPNATTVQVFLESSYIATGPVGAEVFNLLGPTAVVDLVLADLTQVVPATNVATGGGSLSLLRDRSSAAVLPTAALTGTFVANLTEGPDVTHGDIATGVLGGLTFVVDATALTTGLFTEAVYCRGALGAVTVQLPDPALPGNQFRRFLIVDDDGSSGATPIVLTPFGATTLNGAALPKNLSSAFSIWLVTMNGTSCNVAQLIAAP